MTLLGSLQIANNSLLATQVGLQVIGNNVANANTPGYTRQEVVYSPAPTQIIGALPIGLGVQVTAIIQQTDRFINERLRGSISDVESTEAQRQAYLQLESILGELGDNDLSSHLNRFFASIHDVLNQPEDLAVRNVARLQGQILVDEIQRLDERVRTVRQDVNATVISSAQEINRLLGQVATLNIQIVEAEGGSTIRSEAGSLRDQRNVVLEDLAKIIGIRVNEQDSGAVTVFSGGDFLVFDGTLRKVNVEYHNDRGMRVGTINIADSDSPIESSSGKLAGLYTARDTVLGGFLDSLDGFASGLAFEFNKVFSSGQGLTGFDSIESESQVSDQSEPLDQAGLRFTPVNGSFELLVRNRLTGITSTTEIRIDLNGLDQDTSLGDLIEQLDAVEGITATATPEGGLAIEADAPTVEFSFGNDSSGILAALGLNTFFSGTGVQDLGINSVVAADPSKFNASMNGIGEDSKNAVRLANMENSPVVGLGGLSVTEEYERFTGELFQASATVKAVNDGFRTFQKTLEGQQLGISGVNVDEQAVKMIQHQRIFQASARLISSINELLEILVNL